MLGLRLLNRMMRGPSTDWPLRLAGEPWTYFIHILIHHSSIASGRWGSSQLCLLLNPSPSLGAVDFLDRGPPKFLRFNLWLKRKMVGTNGHKIGHVEYLTIRFFWVVPSGNQTGEWKIHKNDVPLKLESTPPIHRGYPNILFWAVPIFHVFHRSSHGPIRYNNFGAGNHLKWWIKMDTCSWQKTYFFVSTDWIN